MKNKRNDEIQSRREFFKKAAIGVLPIVGSIFLMGAPSVVNAAEIAYTDCRYNCSGGCNSCQGTCEWKCQNDCSGSCKGACKRTCKAGCYRYCTSSNYR